MGNFCRMSPVVFKREGTKMKEYASKLYDDIYKALDDRRTSWELWAYTKTDDFKKKYGSKVEYDDLGEPKFLSLIKAIGLENTYNKVKDIDEVTRDYGFNRTFQEPNEAVEEINRFNSKERKFIAKLEKTDKGYKPIVMPMNGKNIEEARQQSYNNALTKELIDLLRSMGFDVSFVSNPKYNGLFDPENATLKDGLITIIKIAKGQLGEEALSEEVSHLLIEGLINHPLVQRLLASLDDSQIHEILGEQYDENASTYENDDLKLKKEAAGKLLGQYITKQGTISKPIVHSKQGLLSRIWNWAKNLFSKITRKNLVDAENRAYDAVEGIYNLISSGEAVKLLDRDTILSADKLYQLKEKFDDLEKIAHEGERITAKMEQFERLKNAKQNEIKTTDDVVRKLRNYNEQDSKYFKSIDLFLNDAKRRIEKIGSDMRVAKKLQEENPDMADVKQINLVAHITREIDTLTEGYEEIIGALATLDEEDNIMKFGNENDCEAIAKVARGCLNTINTLKQNEAAVKEKILYNASRTVYQYDKVRGIGSERNSVVALNEILKHGAKDTNFVDRWLSAMSDADDTMLGIFDSIVKNQQYERDMLATEVRNQIAVYDKKLHDAGYTSDFIYEKDENGVPTGRIISPYDFETYNKELREKIKELRKKQQENKWSNEKYRQELSKWKNGVDKKTMQPRLIEVYINPEYEMLAKNGEKVPDDAITETVPNPLVYTRYANRINNLSDTEKDYYNRMMNIKRTMMTKIPHRGQAIYRAPYISKDFGESIIENSTGNRGEAVLEQFKKHFVRRPDEIGFGTSENLPQIIEEIIRDIKDVDEATEKILATLQEQIDDDILTVIRPQKIKRAIKEGKGDYRLAASNVTEALENENYYIVDMDFADHKIQKLPIYYTRPLKDMRLLSTDFSGAMVAYSAMAINYEKMNEVVDILEVGRDFMKDRKVLEKKGNKTVMSSFKVLGQRYKQFLSKAGIDSSTYGRMNDFMSSVVYEERKMDEGTMDILGINLDVAKTLDAIKDYTGLLGLGFNVFSAFSNITTGKVQQWIDAIGGEYFNVKDYAKALSQYTELMPGCLAEMNSVVKENKLSLLIQMFDPMGEYYESLRNPNFNKSGVSRILGNGILAYIGMNAGEHLLHCQTMLAMLNHTKLNMKDANGNTKEISLYDALEVKEVNGIYQLVLKDGLSYERELIDTRGTAKSNKNFGRPLKDDNGKIKTETVQLKDLHDNATQHYIMKRKKIMRKVNDSLNGAFGANDKGAAHRWAILRMVLQYRQWMPAHYLRRFSRAHYDSDLEQWREGYYVTLWKVTNSLAKDIRHGKIEFAKIGNTLSEHEKANLRRAFSEISIFMFLTTLCKLGGRVKDRDRNWIDKMVLYQINRMKLEVGASMPSPQFFDNIFQLLQSPAASIDTLEKFSKILKFWNMFDEIMTGRYQGWSEYERDLFELIPGADQALKAYYFDDSMFSMFERDN